MRLPKWLVVWCVLAAFFTGASPARAAKGAGQSWPAKYARADYRKIADLKVLFLDFASRYAKHPKKVKVSELLAASSVAYSLWQIEPSESLRKRYAAQAFAWAADAQERDPRSTDAAFLRARAQLANVETQGFLRSLPSIGNIEQMALGLYFREPGYFYGNTPALLGRLYQEAPKISVGDTVRAVEMYQEALSEEKRHSTALLGLAKVAMLEGNGAKAILLLEKLLDLSPWDSRTTWYAKEMDFAWHVDKLRAAIAKKRLVDGESPESVAADFERIPRKYLTGDLAQALRKVKSGAKR